MDVRVEISKREIKPANRVQMSAEFTFALKTPFKGPK